MDETFCHDNTVHKVHHHMLLIGSILGILLLSTLSQAQTIVVSVFSGQSKKVASNVRQALVNALSQQGIRMLSFNQYVSRAKRYRIPQSHALRKTSIQVIAKDMNLDGVVVGSLGEKSGQQRIELFLFDYSGKTVINRTYPVRRRSLTRRTAHKVARLLAGTLKKIAVAKASFRKSTKKPPRQPALGIQSTPAPTAKPITTPPVQKPQVSPDSSVPRLARSGPAEVESVAQKPKPQPSPAASQPAAEVSTITHQRARPAPERGDSLRVGSIPNVSLAAGISGNVRSGLSPPHKSGMIPGFWVSGRVFLGSLVNTTFIKDIGLGGYYNLLLGLEYGPKDAGLTWETTQSHWQGELVYRLAFNHLEIAPAFLLRLGYGATRCKIDTVEVVAVSVEYEYPYGMVDIYLTLFPSLLRFYVTGGLMYLTEAALTAGETETLNWSGSGFALGAGIDLEVITSLNIRVGYELNRFMLNKGREERSDTYHVFMLQIGLRLNSI